MIMSFAYIGKMGSYLRQTNLKKMADQKISTGVAADLTKRQSFSSSLWTANSLSVTNAQNKSASNKMRMASIKRKLKNGDKLSLTDLGFLKENNPGLYRKARAIQDAREELERNLKRAKTKEEARQAMLFAMMKVSGQSDAADASAASVAPGGAAGAVSGGGGGMMAAAGGMDAGAAMDGAPSADAVGTVSADAPDSSASGVDSAAGTSGAETAGSTGESDAKDGAQRADGDEKAHRDEKRMEKKGTLSSMFDDPLDDDSDLPPTKILMIRALQRAWMEFVDSDEFRDLPKDALDAAQREAYGRGNARETRQRSAVVAYRTASRLLETRFF